MGILEQPVGWAKAVARLRSAGEAIVRRAHALHVIPDHAKVRGHGERTAVPNSDAVPPPLPTLQAPPSQPRSETSDFGQSRGAGPEQGRVRMGWGEGIPPSRDRD